jgi:hypothetical protein
MPAHCPRPSPKPCAFCSTLSIADADFSIPALSSFYQPRHLPGINMRGMASTMSVLNDIINSKC